MCHHDGRLDRGSGRYQMLQKKKINKMRNSIIMELIIFNINIIIHNINIQRKRINDMAHVRRPERRKIWLES